MKKPKRHFRILVATFSYGGNGGIKSEVPDVRNWLIRVSHESAKDDRICQFDVKDFADTPVTMCRNQAVKVAIDGGYDFLCMVDSDMYPDVLLGREPTARSFWNTSFSFLVSHYNHREYGVAVGAPYCGPPPFENCYVFRWRKHQTDNPGERDLKLDAYTREEAAIMAGIQPCAALPTGLIFFDVRLFRLTEPKDDSRHSWFYYEYTDKYQTQKASTEDVTATRDLSLACSFVAGYNPIYCNWDAWAGHWKPKCVMKPDILYANEVAEKLANAVRRSIDSDMAMIDTGSYVSQMNALLLDCESEGESESEVESEAAEIAQT